MIPFPTTVDSLLEACVLNVCYHPNRIASFLDSAQRLGPLGALLRIDKHDACWFLAGVLPAFDRLKWACSCARRGKDYFPNFAGRFFISLDKELSVVPKDAIAAVRISSDAASSAAEAVHISDRYRHAYSFEIRYAENVARDNERKIAIRHACMLLGWS